MEEVSETRRLMLPYPVLGALPFGHVTNKVTLPFGALGTVFIREGGYSVRFAGHLQR
jgi:muramoyltetrapeptide carboxypeptidase LdcA involved in peptidoglycan recycling